MSKKESGFTFIETLVTMAIFVVAIGAVITFSITLYRGQSFSFQQLTAINESRRGIETMVKELREAKMGDDGSHILESANDYEIIFYSDIDGDDETEKVRYFVFESNSLDNDCVAYATGDSCTVDFDNFTSGIVDSAEVEICVEGDLNGGNEYVDVYADGDNLGRLCQVGCDQCVEAWQGCTSFDVTSQASEGSISFIADGSNAVGGGGGGFCDWEQENHSLKARFILSWTETDASQSLTLKKGITDPTGYPITYSPDQEVTTILGQYVRNQLPVFKYFDGNGQELTTPARLGETKLIKVRLIINVDPDRAPQDFELESDVQIRNLKDNL